MMSIDIPVPEHDQEIDVRAFSRMTEAEFHRSLAMGHRFVIYYWTLSALFISTTRHTRAYRTHGRRGAIVRGLPYTLVCLLFGWWSFPGGLRNFVSIYHNLTGGVDVSGNVLDMIRRNDPMYHYGLR